jgi:hypothetical protein
MKQYQPERICGVRMISVQAKGTGFYAVSVPAMLCAGNGVYKMLNVIKSELVSRTASVRRGWNGIYEIQRLTLNFVTNVKEKKWRKITGS